MATVEKKLSAPSAQSIICTVVCYAHAPLPYQNFYHIIVTKESSLAGSMPIG
jgi:hypothetical protein